ncbi:MAG TPA: 1-deoxy-D-xylulose-5-phosphate reductoisomerase [Candidatus Faecaligallichristensenella faecipullorum]|nr:1-deoxy-D-xylulose-5-phosphate reductoisomerase [Candidatus Faecaligallichristensenella faecipullorum]
MSERRKLSVLGATGSIGTQALDVVRKYPDAFEIVALTARSSAEKLFGLVREFKPKLAVLEKEPEVIPQDVRFCEWAFGADGLVKAACMDGVQDVLAAVVGIAGLPAALGALDHCERLLLANKEALVTGGALVMEKARRLKKKILPVDSEHSAIFQCLQAAGNNPVSRILLTASGGPFRTWSAGDIERATKAQALGHPTWRMGPKITVDCATMMNKGLEVIEAYWLFGLELDRIEVTVHPQSVVHSMIEFEDGAVLAQMGKPDMRGPISYALGFPGRLPYGGERLSFKERLELSFEAPDTRKFPCLAYAYQAQRQGGGYPVALNGANEAAVEAFLRERIPFGAIARVNGQVLEQYPGTPVRGVEDVYAVDQWARHAAREILDK